MIRLANPGLHDCVPSVDEPELCRHCGLLLPPEPGLALLLMAIEAFDPSAHGNADEPDAAGRYQVRNTYVLRALAVALVAGFGGGIALDPNEPDFPVVYIDLPTGQVSWHITAYDGTWDGHTTAEKYARCEAFRNGCACDLEMGCTPKPCDVCGGSGHRG